ncbi:MAG TPA: Asp-tRNA(Asn)/Glu-tRNA(Gln) amidotransferase subunit GatB [Vicinamibacteria bacterium]|nr:Asp-tRNA(Asn)/Glu-tRNA(Gln) amidotransferase subunit GatB [Vicinamibacteria bacterium]
MSEAYETVIGLECHAQLLTRTKLFCGCPARFGDPPNTNVCPVCLGLPGALPVLNRIAVRLATRMALAVGCQIHVESVFARKNYFYPDLPKGYQISQYDRPLATNGCISIESKRTRIERIHIEEDAGKLLHEGFSDAETKSAIDFNRSGVPLIEIVSEPGLSSPDEAVAYARALKEILEYTETSDADMEKGNFRFDANVSVRREGTSALGTKVEVKNLNSFRFLFRALTYEVDRQIAVLESGQSVHQETRLYDAASERTVSMRSKEEAHDYRYFPDPDLPPLKLEREFLDEIERALPELPASKRERFAVEYGLPSYDTSLLTSTRELAEFFEKTARASNNPKAASNWVMTELLRKTKETGTDISALAIDGEALGRLIRLVDEGKISGQAAKEVFDEMFASGSDPEVIVERSGLTQISDSRALEPWVRRVLEQHKKQADEYREGRQKVLGFLVGQVMKLSQGKANPKLARELLLKMLVEE